MRTKQTKRVIKKERREERTEERKIGRALRGTNLPIPNWVSHQWQLVTPGRFWWSKTPVIVQWMIITMIVIIVMITIIIIIIIITITTLFQIHALLKKYGFDESDYSSPWYMQLHPHPSQENSEAKILWDIPWKLEKCPKDGANEPDISILDKKNKEWSLVEGTIYTLQEQLLKETSTNRTSMWTLD